MNSLEAVVWSDEVGCGVASEIGFVKDTEVQGLDVTIGLGGGEGRFLYGDTEPAGCGVLWSISWVHWSWTPNLPACAYPLLLLEH